MARKNFERVILQKLWNFARRDWETSIPVALLFVLYYLSFFFFLFFFIFFFRFRYLDMFEFSTIPYANFYCLAAFSRGWPS